VVTRIKNPKTTIILRAALVCGLFACLVGCGDTSSAHKRVLLYAINNTEVTAFTVDTASGALSAPKVVAPNRGSVFGMAVHPTARFLYVSDSFRNTIGEFSINQGNGSLTSLPGSPLSLETSFGVNGLAVDPKGRFLYSANLGGSVSGLRIDLNTGLLTEVPGSPFPAELQTDQVAVDPSGRFVYATNQGDALGSISGYAINPDDGVLTPVAGSPFPTFAGSAPHGIVVDSEGRFLYVGVSGGIAGFSIDSATGSLTPVPGSPSPGGAFPMQLALLPSGKFLYAANNLESSVTVFAVDSVTGSATLTSRVEVGNFAWGLAVDPSGKFLYVGDGDSGCIRGFTIDPVSGTPTPMSGSPFPGGWGNSLLIVEVR